MKASDLITELQKPGTFSKRPACALIEPYKVLKSKAKITTRAKSVRGFYRKLITH